MTNNISKAVKPIWFCCFFFCALFAAGQEVDTTQNEYTINGTILKEDETPLAFEELVINNNPEIVISTNSEGGFKLVNKEPIQNIRISSGVYAQEIYVLDESNERSQRIFTTHTWIISPRSKTLGTAFVEGFVQPKPNFKKSGSAEILDSKTLKAGQSASLQNGLQTLPGVRLDSRGYGGSQRISIRGSFLRAPFAVRNIKLYLDGIPLTTTDGQSALELIDVADTKNLEVLKGPSGTVYGAGNGGVLLANSMHNKHTSLPYISGDFTIGDFQYQRRRFAYAISDVNWKISGSKISQSTDGYREQESNDKDLLTFDFTYHGLEKAKFSAKYIRYRGTWGLPGSISQMDVDEDPGQARPFSKSIDARVERERDLLALSSVLYHSNDWKTTATIFGQFNQKYNPFGVSPFFNGQKVENGRSFGGRIESKYHFAVEMHNFDIVAGGELQAGNDILRNYDVSQPTSDQFLKYHNDIDSQRATAFVMAHYQYKALQVGLGLGANSAEYNNIGFATGETENTSLDANINYGFKVLPRAYAAYSLLEKITVFGEYGTGQSLPGFFEVVDADEGILNQQLQAEVGTNLEAGIKALVWKNKLFAKISAYSFSLDNTIVPAQEESGELTYENKGTTAQNGIEIQLSQAWWSAPKGFIRLLKTTQAAALNDFTFSDSYKNDEELNGNSLTGVPMNTFSQNIEIEFAAGFSLAAYHYWTDRTPLNDSNSQWGPAYNVLNAQFGWTKKFDSGSVTLSFGANNVTDTQYTSFYQLNGFGGRFFNPAPGLNYWGRVGFVCYLK